MKKTHKEVTNSNTTHSAGGGDQLTLKSHLTELKRRIFVSLIFFIVSAILTFKYSTEIYQFISKPFIFQLNTDKNSAKDIKMIYTAMGEGFITYLKLSLYSAIFISFPFWLFQAYRFVEPGLLKSEKKVLLPCFLMSPALFVIGAAFLYYFALPLLLQFFLSFQTINPEEINILLYAKLSEYLSFILSLTLAFGLSFQLPVIVIILTKLGLISRSTLKSKRKYAIVIIFVIAAIMTPPDVISQVCLAIPLIVLYELSIFLSKMFGHKSG